MISNVHCTKCGSQNITNDSKFWIDGSDNVQFECGMCDSTNNIQQQLALERERLRLAINQRELALEREQLEREREQLAMNQQKLALEREQQQLALERERQLALERERERQLQTSSATNFVSGVALPPGSVFAVTNSGATRFISGEVTPTGVAFRGLTAEDMFRARGSGQSGGIRWPRTNVSAPGEYPFFINR
jgi:hypothetical protein